jgi:hypothetical protein
MGHHPIPFVPAHEHRGERPMARERTNLIESEPDLLRCPHCRKRIYFTPTDEEERARDAELDALNDGEQPMIAIVQQRGV